MREAWGGEEDTREKQFWRRVFLVTNLPDRVCPVWRKVAEGNASRLWATKPGAELYSDLRQIDQELRPKLSSTWICSRIAFFFG